MIKLLVPDMPTTDELIPYLRDIDERKVYVNRGPLVQRLESVLDVICGAPVVTVNNGTLALQLALKASCPYMYRPFTVLMPALTFCATGLAALSAGFDVDLLDVNPDTWQLSHESVTEWKDKMNPIRAVAAVVPVATFGKPVYTTQWEGFKYPVVIDAAGAFPTQVVSKDQNIATVFSLHATKYVGAGEGGFVASHNVKLIERIRSMTMFGEDGTNGKMSEYHAAVALASLANIKKRDDMHAQIVTWYIKHGINKHISNGIITSTMFVIELPVDYFAVHRAMRDVGIETKQWYRPWLDERAEFVSHDDLPVTNRLRERLLGLPFHNFLTEGDVAYVCKTLNRILK